MHPLHESVFRFFEEELPTYFAERGKQGEIRHQQISMSQYIANSVITNKPVVIEGKEGTGKTLAYLFPLHQLVRKKMGPAIISTATPRLQKQLLERDLPIMQSLGYTHRATLVTGVQDFFCQQEYQWNQDDMDREDQELIELWLEMTETGKLSEIEKSISKKMRALISTSNTSRCDSCMFRRKNCKYWENLKKRDLSHYDFILVDHHLLLSDLLLREQHPNEGVLPPKISSLVIDEADYLESASISLSSNHLSLIAIYRTIKNALQLLHVEEKERESYLQTAELFALLICEELENYSPQTERMPLPRTRKFKQAIESLGMILIELLQSLYGKQGEKQERVRMQIQTCLVILDKINRTEQYVIWFDTICQQIVAMPKENAGQAGNLLYKQYCKKPLPIVITSSTLSLNQSFDHFYRSIGYDRQKWDNYQVELSSPYAYREQALLYLPADLPSFKGKETDDSYYQAVDQRILELLETTKGHALILFTSREHMVRSYHHLKQQIPWTSFTQEDGDLEYFASLFKESRDSLVLFATGEYWNQFDVAGESLIHLILVGLPFPADDPYIEFLREKEKKAGNDPFQTINLPQMMLKMKQGVNRLIHGRQDFGILSILDSHVIKKSYGKQLIASLPKAKHTSHLTEVQSFIENKRQDPLHVPEFRYSRKQVQYVPIAVEKKKRTQSMGKHPITVEKRKQREANTYGETEYYCTICSHYYWLDEEPKGCPTPGCKAKVLIKTGSKKRNQASVSRNSQKKSVKNRR